MWTQLKKLISDKANLFWLVLLGAQTLVVTIFAVWVVARHYKASSQTAVTIVSGVLTAAVTILTGVKTLMEFVKTKNELSAKSAQLKKHEDEQNAEKHKRDATAVETYDAIKAKCNSAPKLEDIKWKDAGFIDQIRWSDKVTEEAARIEFGVGAKLIVVASGKGGVGKSTLALGLTEGFSRFDRTLLVDFDMHNRGLTSLLQSTQRQRMAQVPTNVLAEMERFHSYFERAALVSVPSTGLPDAHKTDLLERFVSMRDEFARAGKEMPRLSLPGKMFTPPEETAPVDPQRADFLPSTGFAANDRFLSSTVFRAQFTEVYFFLKCLCYWAGNHPNRFGTVILDCHGAHDHFMIGAIHAASAVLVVTTPEPGGFDGTYDLLAFAEVLRKETPSGGGNFPTVLAINNCLDWQKNSVDAITQFVKEKAALSFVTPVTIAAEDVIRTITNNYEFGDAAQVPALWAAVKNIQGSFTEYWERRPIGDSKPTQTFGMSQSPQQD